MLIEIHLIQNHAPSNLNRDDTGSPKECVFGGVKRARISSQCLKRSIRRSEIFKDALAGQLGTRTRRLPEIVGEQLLAEGISPEMAAIAAKKVSGFGSKDGKEQTKKDGNDQAKLETAQMMFLTEADIQAVVDVLLSAANEAKTPAAFEKLTAKDLQAKAQQQGFRPITIDVGLFGRMITSEAFRDVEAVCQVAHAISTHKIDSEYDYFTAVDDLKDIEGAVEEDSGAGMIGDVEFTSACFYKYISLDVDGLVDNLIGVSAGRKDIPAAEREVAEALTGRAVLALLQAAIMTTPTGKQNSFAAHQLPAAILVEVRPTKTPVSYANAFVDPARQGGGASLVAASLKKLGAHVTALTNGFNLKSDTRLLLAPEQDFSIDGVENVPDLATLCSRLGTAMAEKVTASHG